MHTRNTPKTHLVPVIKGVSDPAKGMIFRTYHVRPEQLAEALQKATTTPDKIHISHIKYFDKLSKALGTDDITHLRGLFSNESTVWSMLVTRHVETGVHKERSKQKLLQTVYAHVLSQHSVFEPVIKKHTQNASIKKKTLIVHKEKPQKTKKTNPKTPVTEKVSYTPFFQEKEELNPVVLPIIHNKKA